MIHPRTYTYVIKSRVLYGGVAQEQRGEFCSIRGLFLFLFLLDFELAHYRSEPVLLASVPPVLEARK